jgi:hypothetical protein
MSFQDALAATASIGQPERFERFRNRIPSEWIEQALAATGTATMRRRRLPADQVIWLVIGIGLFRDRAIEEVVDALDIALPSPHGAVAKSAIPPARARVGDAPLEWLFERTAAAWSSASLDRHRWRGLALYGIDGSSLRTADTEENRAEFAGWTAGKGDSSNPIVRVVVLMALRSHVLVAAEFGSYAGTSELALARELVKQIGTNSLTILDALYVSTAFLHALSNGEQRHWLTKAKSNTKMRVIEELGDGDQLVEMETTDEALAQDPSLPRTWRARAIRYQQHGFPPRTLLTSLLDPRQHPAKELRDVYHERWEIELAYDELKTEMFRAEVTLRSRSPKAVLQELWGALIAFNLVRLEMERVADEANVAPTRISFVVSLALVRDEWEWSARTRSPGAIPKHLRHLRDRLKRFILPPRRSHRRYPREVKNDYRRYPRRRTLRIRPAK